MKTTGARSLVLYLLGGGFLLGIAVFLYGFIFHGGDWAMQAYNKHLTAGGQLSYAGEVLDRSNVILAKSEGGQRLYPQDEATRRACLHVVGDTNGYISTGVQYTYRSQLAGYNMVTGLTAPTGKSTGNDIKLTIDSRLQKLAWEKFDGRKGAAVLYNYKTGEVLCMMSSPTFDPVNVPDDIDSNETYEGVYLNRALSSAYPPGSIFKLVTSAAALENIPDLSTRKFECPGSITVNGNKITCTATHGAIDFRDGLAKSCNIVFAELAMELGPEKMTAAANQMGFNQSFSLDGIPTRKSVYDVTGAEDNGLAWSGIGQYHDTTNPFHMLLLMGAIANRGVPVQPYLIESVSSPFGVPSQSGHAANGARLVKDETADLLKEYMRYNVTSDYGDDMFPGLAVCAKTGTAEVGDGKKPCGWMVGFSSNENTPLAFAVVVEEGNYGRTSAGPIATALMAEAAKTLP